MSRRKTVEELKASGSYRPAKHGHLVAAGAALPADIAAIPAAISPEMAETWAHHVEDLAAFGIPTRSDLAILERAIVALATARQLQSELDQAITEHADAGNLTRLAAAAGTSANTYARLLQRAHDAVRQNSKARPAPADGFYIDKSGKQRKSIRAILERKGGNAD